MNTGCFLVTTNLQSSILLHMYKKAAGFMFCWLVVFYLSGFCAFCFDVNLHELVPANFCIFGYLEKCSTTRRYISFLWSGKDCTNPLPQIFRDFGCDAKVIRLLVEVYKHWRWIGIPEVVRSDNHSQYEFKLLDQIEHHALASQDLIVTWSCDSLYPRREDLQWTLFFDTN